MRPISRCLWYRSFLYLTDGFVWWYSACCAFEIIVTVLQVMLINLDRWRKTDCTATLEYWMEVCQPLNIILYNPHFIRICPFLCFYWSDLILPLQWPLFVVLWEVILFYHCNDTCIERSQEWKCKNLDQCDKKFFLVQVQKEHHIYELGSLPPLLLTFAGDIQVHAKKGLFMYWAARFYWYHVR